MFKSPSKKTILGLFFTLFLSILNTPTAHAAECSTSSTFSNGYVYVAFLTPGASCTWTIPSDVTTVDYLLVAGGGSGGSRHAGGGGAGGLIRQSAISLSNITSLNITIGAGGASVIPSTYNYAVGLKGNDSSVSKNTGSGSFTTVTATGGGGGESGGQGAQTGGSGGGQQSSTQVDNGTAGQGFKGGAGWTNSSNWSSGGGGGAASAGATATSSGGGNGGAGDIWISSFTNTIASTIGLTLTNQVSGNQVYFAGGGGGSATGSLLAGTGGLGGGTDAVLANNTASNATANSGGGGGASGCCNGGYSGAGGSGIAIFRYPANAGLNLSITGTPIYRTTKTITATANIDGKVTFYANGKYISGCRNRSTFSKTVSCNWKPTLHGLNKLTAAITSSTFSGYQGSAQSNVHVVARLNAR